MDIMKTSDEILSNKEIRNKIRRRSTIKNQIENKLKQISRIENEIKDLKKENCLLSDKTQQFTETEEDFLVSVRPRRSEKRLIGRVNWKEKFKDGDGGFVTVDRTKVVRVNGEWI